MVQYTSAYEGVGIGFCSGMWLGVSHIWLEEVVVCGGVEGGGMLDYWGGDVSMLLWVKE